MSESTQTLDVAGSGLRIWARAAEVVVGLVFVVSALLKAADINEFIVQLWRYGVVTLLLQAYLGIFLIAVETLLGVLLMLGKWRRMALGVSGLLLVVFTGIIFYGWLKLGLDDCGCMGSVKMPPAVSVAKNLVLLGLCVVAWRGLVGLPRTGSRLRRALAAFAAAVVALVAGVGAGAYANGHVERVQPEILGPQPFAAYAFDAEGRRWELGKGEYLVAMLSTTCKHCLHAVGPLNELDRREDVPPVVSLYKGGEQTFEKFQARGKPEFPMHGVGFREFWTLLGPGPPRIFLARDGKVVKVWDGRVPTVEEIHKARGEDGVQP